MYIGTPRASSSSTRKADLILEIEGTSLRDFLYKFRHRTLTLVKMMMLQKRVSFQYTHESRRLMVCLGRGRYSFMGILWRSCALISIP